ncbi:MAG: ATP-binding cassette domain-containing protein [Bdellovibrionaceae bacterium]|nr:ATP-binding cassette domain-containing protein [Pseudobdellovibrionaceae bacterium]
MIELKNLKKTYKQAQIVAVDIQQLFIPRSEITCLIGPSGCGKTSTLKMINRLIEPDEGFIEMNGVKSQDCSSVEWRRKIGYVIQKVGLFPHLTVSENISLLSRVLKRSEDFILERTTELLNLVGLDSHKYKNRYPIQLSGGEQQRVGIARALMEDPPLLLMDEPFGALDPITGSHLINEFIKLNQKLKKTILIVTHDISSAFKMGDKIVLMRKGSIVQEGTKKDFKNKAVNQFVRDFLNE